MLAFNTARALAHSASSPEGMLTFSEPSSGGTSLEFGEELSSEVLSGKLSGETVCLFRLGSRLRAVL